MHMRHISNALLYLVVGGSPWRMLPTDYPNWKTVDHSLRQWRDAGTWQRLHDTLRAAGRRTAGRHQQPTAGWLDRQSVTTSHTPGIRGDASGKKINGRQRHLLVDTRGWLVAVGVTAASVADPAGARRRFARLGGGCKKLRRIWMDGT